MRYETLEDLKQANHSSAFITDYDLAQVNMLVERLEQERDRHPGPLQGDLVTCFSTTVKGKRDGIVSEHARLAYTVSTDGDPLFVVTVHDASVHLTPEDMHLSIGAGGPEYKYPVQDFTHQAEYLGRREATFWIWNFWGAGQGHGISFQASVHAWKIVADHPFI